MKDQLKTERAFCDGLKQVKRMSLDPETLDHALYLGGDIGIDSIEMLEIWFHAERQLGIRIPDDAKRDVYTVGEVLKVLDGFIASTRTEAVDHV